MVVTLLGGYAEIIARESERGQFVLPMNRRNGERLAGRQAEEGTRMSSGDVLGMGLFGFGCLLALGARGLPASGRAALVLAAAPAAGLGLVWGSCG
jgi:hypothetical protein